MKTIDEVILELETQRALLLEQVAPLNEQLSVNFTKLKKLKEKRNFAKWNETASKNAIDPCLAFCDEPHSEGQDCYRARTKFLAGLGLMSGGYWTDTNQSTIKVALTKGDSTKTEKVHESLKLVVPRIKPNKDGLRLVDIFDEGLSQYEHWVLATAGSDHLAKWQIRAMYRGGKVVAKFPNLREALAQVESSYYYDSKE